MSLALFAPLSCGPESGLRIDFSSRALSDQTALVVIYFYGAEQSCADIRAAQPRPVSILGPFQISLNDESRSRGATFTLNEVPTGEYTVFVDALDANGGNVGTGCAPGQRVFDREVSKIQVAVSEV